jgi:hypothetical protein
MKNMVERPCITSWGLSEKRARKVKASRNKLDATQWGTAFKWFTLSNKAKSPSALTVTDICRGNSQLDMDGGREITAK